MNWQLIVVFLVLIFLTVFLYKEYLRPTICFVLAIVVLLLCGIISPGESLDGFANEQVAVIVLLLIISNTLRKTSLMNDFFHWAFKRTDSSKNFLFKMLSAVGISSAFLNNTPLVAMMMPFVYKWSKEQKTAASLYLIPLSYASILGGCVTLIGTSTNLIANGLAIEYGEDSLAILDFAYVGLPMLLIGIAYLFIFQKKLLPQNVSTIEQATQREYLVETYVQADSNLIGKSVLQGSLRKLQNLYLVEIIRNGRPLVPVSPDIIIEANDKLFFAGDIKNIGDLALPTLGLSLPHAAHLDKSQKSEVMEVIIAPQSNLVGVKVNESDFRGKLDGAIMAVHRSGSKVEGKIGDIILEAGDVLLVLGGSDFMGRIQNNKNFYLLSRVKEINHVSRTKSYGLLLGLLLSIGLAFYDVPLFISLSAVVLLSILFKIQKITEVKNKVDFDLIIIIAMGLALGKAMVNTGFADLLSDLTVDFLHPLGNLGLIAGFFLLTNVLSSFITSKAAVAIVLPVALTTAHALNLPVPPFVLVVAFGGAANFMTPVGYQTNLMVYGPGGYKFIDFVRIGLPLTLIYLIVCTAVLAFTYNLY